MDMGKTTNTFNKKKCIAGLIKIKPILETVDNRVSFIITLFIIKFCINRRSLKKVLYMK